MRVLLLLARLCVCEIVTVRIFYEKEVGKAVQGIHSWFVDKVVSEYNKYLKKAGILVRLAGFSDLMSYDITEETLELEGIGGSDDINNRRRIVNKMSNGVILIASTSRPFNEIFINKSSACNVKLITTFLKDGNTHDDTMTRLISSYQSWLGAVLKAHVPNIFESEEVESMETLVSNLVNSNYKKEIAKCNNMNGALKSRVEPTDAMHETVNSEKLDKIKNLLEILINRQSQGSQKTGTEEQKLKPPADLLNKKDKFSEKQRAKIERKKRALDDNEETEEGVPIKKRKGVRLDLLDENRKERKYKTEADAPGPENGSFK